MGRSMHTYILVALSGIQGGPYCGALSPAARLPLALRNLPAVPNYLPLASPAGMSGLSWRIGC